MRFFVAIIKKLMDQYENRLFILPNGEMDLTTCVNIAENVFTKVFGDKIERNCLVNIDNVKFFPTEYFCPLDYKSRKMNITENTHAIHWYGESWLPDSTKKINKIKRFLRRILGEKLTFLIKKVVKK